MNHHPAHYFIRFLLVTQDDISVDAVNVNLGLYGFASITEEYLKQCMEELGNPPQPFRPWTKADKPSTQWLRSKRIFSLFHPDESTKALNVVLADFQFRETVERLLLGNVDPREMSYRMKKLGYSLSVASIHEFRHYFWNTELLGPSDWAEYFAMDAKKSTGSGRTTYGGGAAYLSALSCGPNVAMYRLGIRKELDIKKVLVDMQDEVYHTFLEARSLPLSQAKVEMLSTLVRTTLKIDERMQQGDTALQSVLQKFEKFKVLTDSEVVPSLIELAPTGSISDKTRAEIIASSGGK